MQASLHFPSADGDYNDEDSDDYYDYPDFVCSGITTAAELFTPCLRDTIHLTAIVRHVTMCAEQAVRGRRDHCHSEEHNGVCCICYTIHTDVNTTQQRQPVLLNVSAG